MPYHTIHYHTLPYTTPYHTTISLHYIHTYIFICVWLCVCASSPKLATQKSENHSTVLIRRHSDAWRMQRLVPCKGLQGTFCRMLTSIRWPICWHVHCREPILQPKAATATTAATAATAWLIEEIRHGQKSPRRCIERGVAQGSRPEPESWPENSETGIFDLRADLIRVSTKVTDKLKSNKFC